MTEDEAWELVLERAESQPDVEFTDAALEAAVDRLLGRKPSGRAREPVEPVKVRVSPLAAHSRGLHEKHSPENRA